jgi:hypothetical protein
LSTREKKKNARRSWVRERREEKRRQQQQEEKERKKVRRTMSRVDCFAELSTTRRTDPGGSRRDDRYSFNSTLGCSP